MTMARNINISREDAKNSTENDEEMVKLHGKVASQGQMSQQMTNDDTADITLVVGTKHYLSHKATLARASPYFQRMFDGDWKERKTDTIELQETQACEDVFETFLSYFNHGTVCVNSKTVTSVVILADKYDVAGLKEMCEIFMIDVIIKIADLNRVLEWLPFAEQMNMHVLLMRCYSVLCFNLEKASILPHWHYLSHKQFLAILKRPDIVVSGEYKVYQAMEAWLRGQEEVTSDMVATLIPYIQFKNMTVEELCQVEESTLVTDSKRLTQYLLKPYLYDAFRYVAVKEKYPEGKNEPAIFQRYYSTITNSLKSVRFEGKGTVNLEPKCEWAESAEPSYYPWTFGKSPYSAKYHVRLPYSSREYGYGTSYLSDSLPGSLLLRVTFFFFHKNSVILSVMSDTCETEIPAKSSGGTLGEFTEFSELSNYSYESHGVKYTFSIEKMQ